MNWKYTLGGLTAYRTNADGSCESRLVSAIPANELTTCLPADPVIPQPNGAAFAQAVKAGMGGIVAANALSVSYPLFFAAVQTENWPDLQALILDAHAKSVLNAAQYAAIKSAVITHSIPIALP